MSTADMLQHTHADHVVLELQRVSALIGTAVYRRTRILQESEYHCKRGGGGRENPDMLLFLRIGDVLVELHTRT